MSLPDEFIRMARALAFYRKFKHRRAKRRGRLFTDTDGLKGWSDIGSGFYGEAWSHEDYQGLVVKISGRAGFGLESADMYSREPSLDGWPVFAEHCFANPHPNLPKIMYFERLSLGISFGIMPYYVPIETDVDEDAEILDRWCGYLEGDCGAPKWMWPIIGMRDALGMAVDLHSGNVMKDPNTGAYIMTDPFSPFATDADGYY